MRNCVYLNIIIKLIMELKSASIPASCNEDDKEKDDEYANASTGHR